MTAQRFRSSYRLAFAILLASLALCSANAEETTIGCSTDLSGPAASWATFALTGAKSVFNDLNNKGGVAGKKINFLIFNDAYNAKRAIENFESLSGTQTVSALLLDWGTPTSLALLPSIKSSHTLLLFPISGSSELRSSSAKNVFTLRPSTYQEAKMAIDFGANQLRLTKVALLEQDDSFGTDGREAIEQTLQEHGHRLLGSAKFLRAEPKMTAAADALMKLQPQGIYVQSNPVHAVLFVSEMRKRGYDGYFFFPSIVGVERLIDAFGEKADHMIVTEAFPLVEASPAFREFNEAMKQANISLPRDGGTQFLYEGYLGARLTVEALKRQKKGRTLGETILAAPFKVADSTFEFDRQTRQVQLLPHLFLIDKGYQKEMNP